MNEFQRTQIKAEQQINLSIKNHTIKLAKEEIYASSIHLETSMEKMVELLASSLEPDAYKKFVENIDNVYYHIGKIRGSSNAL